MRFLSLRTLPLVAALLAAGFYWGCGSDDDDKNGGATGTGGSSGKDSGTDGSSTGSGGSSSGSGGSSAGSGGGNQGSGGSNQGGGGAGGGTVVQGASGTITIPDGVKTGGKVLYIAAFDKYPSDQVPWFRLERPGSDLKEVKYGPYKIDSTGEKIMVVHLDMNPDAGTCKKDQGDSPYCWPEPGDPYAGPIKVNVLPNQVLKQDFTLQVGDGGTSDAGAPDGAPPADASTDG